MNIVGDYRRDGFALLERLLPLEVTKALMDQLWADVAAAKVMLAISDHETLSRRAFELHAGDYPQMSGLHWGLTPTIAQIAGRALLPTYCYFRVYSRDHQLKVHADRAASEHGLSLTLRYSEDEIWPFEIARRDVVGEVPPSDDFGDEQYSSLPMGVGDAVLYRATRRRHGRLRPNPNQSSAHLFLFWVEADGPLRHLAFERPEKNPVAEKVPSTPASQRRKKREL